MEPDKDPHEIWSEAYSEGESRGYDDGYHVGSEEGYRSGLKEGHDISANLLKEKDDEIKDLRTEYEIREKLLATYEKAFEDQKAEINKLHADYIYRISGYEDEVKELWILLKRIDLWVESLGVYADPEYVPVQVFQAVRSHLKDMALSRADDADFVEEMAHQHNKTKPAKKTPEVLF